MSDIYAEVTVCYTILICILVHDHVLMFDVFFFFFSSRRRHTRLQGDWSSDVCSSDLFRIGLSGAGANSIASRMMPAAVLVVPTKGEITSMSNVVVIGGFVVFESRPDRKSVV